MRQQSKYSEREKREHKLQDPTIQNLKEKREYGLQDPVMQDQREEVKKLTEKRDIILQMDRLFLLPGIRMVRLPLRNIMTIQARRLS